MSRYTGFVACAVACPVAAETGSARCPDLILELNYEDALPMSRLENGDYLFLDGRPLTKECLRKRACQVDDFVRENFHQSYYISLKERGGAEIERQFPDVIAKIVESRGDERYFYLSNFCRATAEDSDRSSDRP